MLYATVQGTELADTSLHANLVIVQDGATEVPSTPSAVTPPGEQPKTSNEQQARGKVLIVTSTMLHIDGYAHDIILNTATKVEQVGAGTSTLADIKVGQTVQVHVSVSGTTCTATQVHIEDKAVKPGTSTPTPPQGSGTTPEQPSVSNKTGDKVVVNGVITAASPASLTVAGKTFAITADTQMKYHGKAITPADLVTRFLAGKLAATVQGTELADTSLRANLVIVQDAPDSTPQEGTEQPEPDPSVQTWQGTIAAVFPPAGSDLGAVLVSAAAGQPVLYRMTSTSVLQGTKANGGHYALTLAALQALPTTPPQAVTIEGKLLADGTVAIVKLTVTTVSTTAVTEPTNPGKGKGNDKPGKN